MFLLALHCRSSRTLLISGPILPSRPEPLRVKAVTTLKYNNLLHQDQDPNRQQERDMPTSNPALPPLPPPLSKTVNGNPVPSPTVACQKREQETGSNFYRFSAARGKSGAVVRGLAPPSPYYRLSTGRNTFVTSVNDYFEPITDDIRYGSCTDV